MPAFIRSGNFLLNASDIERIDCSSLEATGQIIVHMRHSGGAFWLHGIEAIDALMTLKPSMVEGRRLKFIRHHWAFHNLVAHPLLQACAWLGMSNLGFKIHDMTVPRPK